MRSRMAGRKPLQCGAVASDPQSQKRTRQAIGAVVLVVIAFAIAMQLRAKRTQPEELSDPLVSSALPSPADASGSSPPAHALAHYVSALLPKGTRILGLSSGAGTSIAVGERGAIFRFEVDHPGWTAEPPVTERTLRAVAQQLDRAVAVGDDGTIVELEGGRWSVVPSPTKRTLRAVVHSVYGVVAVGDGGTIVSQLGEGQPWRAEPSVATSDLFGACSGLRDLWVVGAGGAALLRGPEGWKAMPPISNNALYAVACDDHAAVAVGAQGTIVQRLDDVGWHATSSGTAADLFAISAPMGTKSFLVVGAAGTILHLTNDVAAEPQSVGWALRATTEGALGTWVGGDEGLLRRATD